MRTRFFVLIGALALLAVGTWISLTPSHRSQATPEFGAAPASDDVLPSERIIANGDLPPAGTQSLFDQHIETLGELPYPFSALLDSLRPLDHWNEGYVGLLIPDGRSLARKHADNRQPRVLAAAQIMPREQAREIPRLYSGRLFLGFVEAVNSIEIIAYNEAAGRFEFQLVKNYCEGCKPEILYARRAICQACHQAGTPIFAVRPWSESNASASVARGIAEAQQVAWLDASAKTYHGVTLSTQIVAPESFDERVQQASRIRLAQQVWLDGCSDVACRRQLLMQALSLLLQPGAFDPNSAANQALRELQARHWPADGIALPNDRLPDRVPGTATAWQRARQSLSRFWRQIRSEKPDLADSQQRLAALDPLPDDALHLDPLALRQPSQWLDSQTLEGVQALAAMFSPQDRKLLLAWSDQSPQRILKLLSSGQLDDQLTPQPFRRVLILQTLARMLGHPQVSICCQPTSKFPAQAEDRQALSIAPGSPLELFSSYCFDCHRGNPVAHLNFMAGDNEGSVLRALRHQKRILEVLDYEHSDPLQQVLMPPPHSAQRARLDAARSQGLDDLQRMRDALR